MPRGSQQPATGLRRSTGIIPTRTGRGMSHRRRQSIVDRFVCPPEHPESGHMLGVPGCLLQRTVGGPRAISHDVIGL